MKNAFRFVTCKQYPNGTSDDQRVLEPLASRNLSAEFSIWNDPKVNWQDGRPVILRSPWDYWEAKQEFIGWLTSLAEAQVRLLNPFDILKWNFDKIYLSDIEKKGHFITPTQFYSFSTGPELMKMMGVTWIDFQRKFPWIKKMIVKPRVSANAWKTYVVSDADLAGPAVPLQKFQDYEIGEKLMIQPFLEDVISQGEWSLFYFWGEWSHTCLKTPAEKDFRVQEEHGGYIREAVAPAAVRKAADGIAADFARDLLYARVDIVLDQGLPLLMELEVIEPSLYLRMSSGAAENFARALARV